jgi:outer membrane protein assembly factor BamB/tetratricopeptide (TPR) repeat protein
MFGGNPGRNGQGRGGAPAAPRRWSSPLFGGSAGANEAKQLISDGPQSAVKLLEAKGEAVIPASQPVVVTITTADGKQKSFAVFRSYGGVHAVEVKSGKIAWVSPSVWSLERMLGDGQKRKAVQEWVGHFKDGAGRPDVLLGNANLGTMSSDGSRVYYIDDLQVPFDAAKFRVIRGALVPGVSANKLQAVQVASGKLLWELGGDGPALAGQKHDFRNTHFLGAPLCLGGKLYFLNEKDQEIRLVCFDAGKVPNKATLEDLDAAVAWVQPLGIAKERIIIDYGRRINGAPIAYGEGVLVCPTNAGVLVGVDVLTHGVLWTHAYPAPAGAAGEWKASAPVVQDGKVVFALPDGPELRCLRLRDGKLLWGTKRGEDGVYLAGVFAGRAVVVGKKDVRGLDLAGGKEQWRVPTGLPSGRGAASDNVYYLPLRDADGGKGPAVVAIDVAKGKLVSVDRMGKDRDGKVEVLGNLTFFGGQVISQSATEVVGFPALKDRLKEIDNLLKKNPKDPDGLFLRGQLRVVEGKLLDGIEDFRAARANTADVALRARVGTALHDALTELLRRDFAAGEKYFKEYEELSRESVAEEGERERRLLALAGLKARRYEEQGKVVDALNVYVAATALVDAAHRLPEPDDLAERERRDVWAREGIVALYDGAKPPARQLLEDEVGKKWKALRDEKETAALRTFVSLFSSRFAAGREAQLTLAERLMEREGKQDWIDAELLLLKLSRDKEDSRRAGQAVEALARLMIRKGMLEDAVQYYRDLARDYPTTVIRDGKKGADFLNDLKTDKRFLPYLKPAPGGK